MSNNTIISFENVNKFYEDTHVLKNINFEIEKGKFYTLLGPSGCGKQRSCVLSLDLQMYQTEKWL